MENTKSETTGQRHIDMKNNEIIPTMNFVDPFDYFAGQALSSLAVPQDHPDHNPKETAEQSYDYAIEMLKARKAAMQFLSDAGYVYEKY